MNKENQAMRLFISSEQLDLSVWFVLTTDSVNVQKRNQNSR